MPISLPPFTRVEPVGRPSRRGFMAGSLAAAAGAALGPLVPDWLSGAGLPATRPAADGGRVALLSDIHIDGDPKTFAHGVNMADNLKRVAAEVIERWPPSVLIDGDLAHLHGKAGDYATMVELLKPLRDAGLPVHLTMGNHDSRANFWAALPPEDAARKSALNRPVEGRQAMVIETAPANWFILDSLDRTAATTGALGDRQLKWLASALDAATNKPALVMVHHNPDHGLIVTGLRDTAALLGTILPRKHVKALFFGHTHDWSLKRQDGLHLVNLPPVAYVFGAGKPNGWVEGTVVDGGMSLLLHCLDKKHVLNERTFKLEWR